MHPEALEALCRKPTDSTPLRAQWLVLRNSSAVRVAIWSDRRIRNDVFQLLGCRMHMIGSKASFVDEVMLPKAVPPNDVHCRQVS